MYRAGINVKNESSKHIFFNVIYIEELRFEHVLVVHKKIFHFYGEQRHHIVLKCFSSTAMFLWEWSIAKLQKRSPVNVGLTQVLSLCKVENERSQHTDWKNNQQFKNIMNSRIKVFVCKY